MHLPNYKNKSIVNLMSSLSCSFGINHEYAEHESISQKELKKYKNTILLIIDGLGYTYLKKYGSNSILTKHLRSKMTSVFPSTTAAAITTFKTSLAPSEHAITGWHMFFRELGCIITPLKHSLRPENAELKSIKGDIIVDSTPFMQKVTSKGIHGCTIMSNRITDTVYSNNMRGSAESRGYSTLKGLFQQIKSTIRSNQSKKKKSYIYSYWGDFDMIAHYHGISSNYAYVHYKEICDECEKLINYLKDKDTLLIICSDHGLIDTSNPNHIIDIKDHPKLRECLAIPLCGKLRVPYCYIKPEMQQKFESYVKRKMHRFCTPFKTSELIKKGWFGNAKKTSQHPELPYRLGDYILVMKDGYVMIDPLASEKGNYLFMADHGGVSEEEMYVPLIMVGS